MWLAQKSVTNCPLPTQLSRSRRVSRTAGAGQFPSISDQEAIGRLAPPITRQHIFEALVGEGQRVGIRLAQAQSEAARGRRAASEVEAGGGTVDRVDGKAVLGKEQRRRPTPQPRSSTCCVPRAFSTSAPAPAPPPPGAARPSRRGPPALSTARPTPRPLSPPSTPPRSAVGCALSVIISGKRRCASRKWSAPDQCRFASRRSPCRRPLPDGACRGRGEPIAAIGEII
jgi:hypothetical protein